MQRWNRRSLLGTASAMTAASMLPTGMARAQAAKFSAGTGRPTTATPAHLTDCHVHAYDARFPRAGGSDMPTPPDATAADFKVLQARLGIGRAVFSQSHAYGTDNRAMLEALRVLGRPTRGIAVLEADVHREELQRLNVLGVRGLRMELRNAADVAEIEAMAERVAPLNWHIEISSTEAAFLSFVPRLERLPVAVLLEHLGYLKPSMNDHAAALEALLAMLRQGNTWGMISGPYLLSKAAPRYDDIRPMVEACVRAAPGRLVWASDWPHSSEAVKPDDAQWFDRFAEWVPDTAVRTRILVDNPARLYGFSAAD
jgi:D-galactarolactone isomerase